MAGTLTTGVPFANTAYRIAANAVANGTTRMLNFTPSALYNLPKDSAKNESPTPARAYPHTATPIWETPDEEPNTARAEPPAAHTIPSKTMERLVRTEGRACSKYTSTVRLTAHERRNDSLPATRNVEGSSENTSMIGEKNRHMRHANKKAWPHSLMGGSCILASMGSA